MDDIHEFVHACHSCQEANASTKKLVSQVHLLLVPHDKFNNISMDFIGPLPSADSHDYVLTIVDQLTGFIELASCSTTINVCDLHYLSGTVESLAMAYHYPSPQIATPSFASHFQRTVWDEQDVCLMMSTSFHPQTDSSQRDQTRPLDNHCKVGLTDRALHVLSHFLVFLRLWTILSAVLQNTLWFSLSSLWSSHLHTSLYCLLSALLLPVHPYSCWLEHCCCSTRSFPGWCSRQSGPGQASYGYTC